MRKKVIVLSLGGSQIIPDEIGYKYISEFKKVLLKNCKSHKFVVVCGGGSLARKYITALKKDKKNATFQSLAGISATRTNARFMHYFFGMDPHKGIPHTLETVKDYMKTRDIVFCGALEYKPNQTSDSTAAEISRAFKAPFINLTNVKGLYDKNPLKFKKAKYIPKITWKNFNERAQALKFKPGQHFVLDQTASKMILKHKIPTYLIKDLKQLNNFLKRKKFIGTTIQG